MFRYLIISTLITFSCYAEDLSSICSPTDCYQIVGELGEGAFGKVYQVENSINETFALKSYKPNETTEDSWWEALGDVKREFERGQELNHPNIIRSIELFSQEDDNYLVLDFVKGDALFKIEKQSISFDASIIGTLQLIEALRYGVTLDLYHLDLHEGNVMLSDDSEIMVVDLASFFTFGEVIGISKTSKGVKQPKKLREFFEKNPTLRQKLKKAKGPSTYYEGYKRWFHQNYFERITEICANIIKKSDLPRDERMKLKASIKKLSWIYREDLEDGLDSDLNEYLDALIDMLSHLPTK